MPDEERRQNPDRREPGWYEDMRKELTEHAERIEHRLRRFYSRALGAFAVMGIACAIALAGFGVVLDAQGDTTAAIQDQRYDALLENCLDTNVRHDRVIKRIDQATSKLPRKQRQRSRKQTEAFKSILEAAVPYTTDCRKFASSRLRGG